MDAIRGTRRPATPGQNAPAGTCRYCWQPTGTRARAHPECRDQYRKANVPTEVRKAVFERDGWTCIDCHHRLPESLLEADHDVELTDGGHNDPGNFITRCLDCHDDKTQERRMARTATTSKHTTRGSRTAATAQLPEKPSAAGPARNVAGLAVFATGAHVAAYPWVGDTYIDVTAAAVAGTGLAAAAIHGLRYVHWRRTCESQRVYERLAKITGDPYAGRKARFRVNTWGGVEPHVVTLRYGTQFADNDPAAWAKLETAFAGALRVAHARVKSEHLRGGRARLSLRGDERAPRDAHAHPEPTGALTYPEGADDRAPQTLARDEAAARVRDALDAVVEGCQVEVTAWHPDGSPAALVVTYPAASTKAAREARADLPVLMADVYAPRTTNGRWHVQWQPARDRFVLTDEPDALAPIVALPPIEADLDLAAGPILGITEAGEPWRLPLLHNHVLVAGGTGAGKGSVLWGIVRGLYALIEAGLVKLWVIDPKGGMELGVLEPIAHRFADALSAAEVAEEAAEAMEAQAQRLRRAGSRKLETPTRENPLHIVMVDEVATVTSLEPDAKRRAAFMSNFGRLLTQGRAVGFCVVSALQDPSKETLKQRNLFPGRVALRLDERIQVDMVLGAGARASGATCDMIPRSLPGVGYVAMDGKAGYLRVRAAFVPDAELERLTTPQRPAPPHQAPTMGEQLVLDAPATSDPAPVGEVLTPAETPTTPAPQPRAEKSSPTAKGKKEPVQIKDLHKQSETDPFTLRRTYLLPDDEDPVTITSIDADTDDPEYRAEVTYKYVGEEGERVFSFEWTDTVTPA